ncbi:MAG: beta-L-arabinofuranosidase domain-containing protein [Anaerolineae bacterium]
MTTAKQAADHQALCVTGRQDAKVLYFGQWVETKIPLGQGGRRSNTPYNACVLPFRGSTVRWLGAKGPEYGHAKIYVDGVLEQTIDAYAPTALPPQVLFEKTGLAGRRIHTLRIVVSRERNPAASDCFQMVCGFESRQPVDYPKSLKRAAVAELRTVANGTKAYVEPETWEPVAYAATAPVGGVTLQGGPLRDCFDRNITYLNRCFAAPYYSDAGDNNWVQALPASAEGRLLGGAGHTLRWGERADMRRIVDTIVRDVGARQTPEGYCLPYDETYMEPQKVQFVDERRNYDRVNLTRGLIAAGLSGDPEAYGILRRFYDWLNLSPYYPHLLSGAFHNSGSNCNNGHAGGPLMYFSPVGKAEDMVAVERYFVQDFFLDQARQAEPLSLDYYPLHTPHSYVLLAFEAWLDHYRATGATKYLEAARGAWQIVHKSYEHVGGTIAICEMGPGNYPPGSYHLAKHTGETCGSVFWADFNHRFLQWYPEEERYAAEIEQVLFNVILAAQDDQGSIRYHNHLHGAKEAPQCANTCCEVMGVPFIGRLPQFIYSLAEDGLYVNLFAPSRITWTQGGRKLTLTTETAFPYACQVALTVATPAPEALKLRVRMPAWTSGDVPIRVNGEVVTTGQPGSYVCLDRTWANNDRVTFDLPIALRLVKYTGLDQDARYDRYALTYGPLLMALVGGSDLAIAPDDLTGRLSPIAKSPLHLAIDGYPAGRFMPYWQIQEEDFTCFPTLHA